MRHTARSRRWIWAALALLFVPAALAQAAHPRLLFSASDVPAIRAQAQTTHAEIIQKILANADDQLREPPEPYPCGITPTPLYSDASFVVAGENLTLITFAYVATGNTQYRDRAKQALLAVSAWPSWGGNWLGVPAGCTTRDSGLGGMLFGAALAYDWLYNDLSPAEQATVRAALGAHAQEMYEAGTQAWRPDWLNWWGKSYSQNHVQQDEAGLGLAALALEGEDARAATWLALATDTFTRVSALREGGADGTWHEGLNYQGLGLSYSLPFLESLRRVTGQDLLPHTYLRNFMLYRTYNFLPQTSRSLLNFADNAYQQGDRMRAWELQNIMRFVAREYGDGRAEWLAQQFIATQPRAFYPNFANWYIFEFLHFNPGISPLAPDAGAAPLPLNRTFPDLEGVIWRTGWGQSDLVFGIKTGAFGGRYAVTQFTASPGPAYPYDNSDAAQTTNINKDHDDKDTNTFYLSRGATDLASEYSSYGKGSTYYHNTLMVDREDQYWNVVNHYPINFVGGDGRLEAAFGTSNFDFLTSDATNRYRQRQYDADFRYNGRPGERIVTAYKRHVLFVRPDYFVMVDNIEAPAAHQYEWVFHGGGTVAGGSTLTVETDWLRAQQPTNQILGVKILAPSPFLTAPGNETEADRKPALWVRPSGNVANARFVTVLYPTDLANWAAKPAITSLGDTPEIAGVRVVRGTLQEDHLVHYGGQASGALFGYMLGGRAASVITDVGSGALVRLFVGQATSLQDTSGSRVLLERATPLVLEVNYNGPALALFGEEAAGARIYAPAASPLQVTLNGALVSATKAGDYITVASGLPVQADTDVDNDGSVTLQDLLAVAADFRKPVQSRTYPPAGQDPGSDVTADGTVDILDLVMVASDVV